MFLYSKYAKLICVYKAKITTKTKRVISIIKDFWNVIVYTKDPRTALHRVCWNHSCTYASPIDGPCNTATDYDQSGCSPNTRVGVCALNFCECGLVVPIGGTSRN